MTQTGGLRGDLHQDISYVQDRQERCELLAFQFEIGFEPTKSCSSGGDLLGYQAFLVVETTIPCVVSIDLFAHP